jgi:hypothetical protein
MGNSSDEISAQGDEDHGLGGRCVARSCARDWARHQRRDLLPVLTRQTRRVAFGLLGDLGHPTPALSGPHPELETQPVSAEIPNFRFSKTASDERLSNQQAIYIDTRYMYNNRNELYWDVFFYPM